MKKLIVSLILLMGLSFNANATPAFITPPGSFFLVGVAFNELLGVKYEACNNLPYRTVMRKGTNFYFDVSECDYQKYKDNYK